MYIYIYNNNIIIEYIYIHTLYTCTYIIIYNIYGYIRKLYYIIYYIYVYIPGCLI